MMPILVKGDDIRTGTKSMLVMAGCNQHRIQWVKVHFNRIKKRKQWHFAKCQIVSKFGDLQPCEPVVLSWPAV